jgi:hypothetical protein
VVAPFVRSGVGVDLGIRRWEDKVSGLYTKNGIPLQVSGEQVFNPSGRQFGRISGAKVYGPDGKYVGTIDGDRLAYRSADSASVGSRFMPARHAGSVAARAARSAVAGEEPNIDG